MTEVGFIPQMEDFVVSATQVSTYELCPRKWAFRYIDGIVAPPNKFAVLGVDTHGHLEHWFKYGTVPGLSRAMFPTPAEADQEKSVKLAQALIPLLPPPQMVDPANVEKEQYYELCGVKFNLVVDLFMPKWRDELPTVFDHKTGGNPDYWLTPEKMTRDIQCTLYAGWALHKIYTAPACDLQWNYVRTKGAIVTQPVVARVNGRAIQERLGQTLETAREMKVVMESGARALQIEYNASGCDAFGGCPYKERCNLQPADRLRSIMSNGQQPMTSPSTAAFLGALAPPNGQQPMMAPPMHQQPMQQPMQQQPMSFAQPAPQAPMVQQQVPMPQPSNQMVNPPPYVPVPEQQPMVQQAQQPMVQQQPMTVQQQPAIAMPMQQQQPMPVAQPAQEPAKGRGRPAKLSADDPWVVFVANAPAGYTPEQQCQYADYMMAELHKRRG